MPPDPEKNSKPAICPLISTIAVMAGPSPANSKIVAMTVGPQVVNFSAPCVGDGCAWFVDGRCAIASIARVLPDLSASATQLDYLVHLEPAYGPGFVAARALKRALDCQSGMELRQPAEVTTDRPSVNQAERSAPGKAVQPVVGKER